MGHLRKFIQKGLFAEDKFDKKYPFDLKSQLNLYYRSFGEKNSNKKFLVIWRDFLGSGFFSNFNHISNYIRAAEELGFIPIVDFQNFKTLYNEKNPVNDTSNAWEYYFDQISPYTLEEVYASKNVYFCGGNYLHNLFPENTKTMKDIWDKYIKLKPSVQNKVDEYLPQFKNSRVLGVHFRGKEQKYAPLHPFPPTTKQMLKHTDDVIKKFNIDKIFLVTEEKLYLDAYKKKYGDKLIHTDAFRVPKVNAYNLNPRMNHRYLLGLDALYEALLLSKCTGMLYSSSNLSGAAEALGDHEFLCHINNGTNSRSAYVARYLYDIKKLLPAKHGGLLNQLSITDKRNDRAD